MWSWKRQEGVEITEVLNGVTVTIQKGSIAKRSKDLEMEVMHSQELMHSQVWGLRSRVSYLSEGRWLLNTLDFSVRRGHQDISRPLEPKQWARAKPLISTALSQYWIIYYRSLLQLFGVWFHPTREEGVVQGRACHPNTLHIWFTKLRRKKKFSGCKNSVVLYLQFFGYSWSCKVFCYSTAIYRNFSSVWTYKQLQEVWNMLLRLFSWCLCHRFSCHSVGDALLSFSLVGCLPYSSLLKLLAEALTSLLKKLPKRKWRPVFQLNEQIPQCLGRQ